jgi:ACDE family multidrug resistance protein
VAQRQVLAVFLASASAFIILYGSYLTFLPFLLEHRFGAAPWVIGLVFSSASVVTALASWQLGRLTRHVSERTLIAFGFALYAVTLLAIPFGQGLVTVTLPVIAYGAANGICLPAASSLLAGLAPLENRAAFMSLNGTVLRLGQTLGPIAMGAVYGRWGVDATFYAGAGVALGSLLLVVGLMRPSA